MQNLSPRHVKTEESLRLGVVSGADCLRRIAEINPPPVAKKRMVAS
jgi:hypothetical protein